MKILALLLLVLASHPATAATKPVALGFATKKIRWLVAHGPRNLIEEATQEFADSVKRRTQGEYEVEVVVPTGGYAENALAPSDAIAMVKSGEYEMSQVYTSQLGSLDNRFWILDLPFLFESHYHAARVLDGKIGRGLLAGLAEKNRGLRGLAFTYSGGYRLVPTSSKKIEKAEDFSGLKLTSMGDSPVFSATLEAFHAVAVKMRKRDIPDAVGKGVIDGFESTYTRYGDLEPEQRVTKVLNETFHSLHLTAIVVNEKFYQSLPAKVRKVLSEAAQEAALSERKISINQAEEYREKRIKSGGIEIVTLPSVERGKLRALGSKLWGAFPEYFSEAAVQAIHAERPR